MNRRKRKAPPVIVSACLVGINCRFDGGDCLAPEVLELLIAGRAIPVCPEQLGGMPTPRLPCEIIGGDGSAVLKGRAKVVDKEGKDWTSQFLQGAEEVARIATVVGARKAILKQNSPSCGFGQILRGQKPVKGVGVTAARLLQMGVEIEPV